MGNAMLITSSLAMSTINFDWSKIDLKKAWIDIGYREDLRIPAKVMEMREYQTDKLVLFNVSSSNQQELVNMRISYNRIP